MTEKNNPNCIVKAFENNPISIIEENIDNKKIYWFRASDIGNALKLSNINVSIQNYDEDERGLRKAYTPEGGTQQALFLTSQGVYRLLYNSKKEIAKKFRKWAGNILDDIIFNESNKLKRQLEEQQKKIEMLETRPETEGFFRESGYIYIIKETAKLGRYKIGKSKNPIDRISGLNVSSSEKSLLIDRQFETVDVDSAEKTIHLMLKPYRIKKRAEWFFFKYKT